MFVGAGVVACELGAVLLTAEEDGVETSDAELVDAVELELALVMSEKVIAALAA